MKSLRSYLADFGRDQIRHLHANKIRHYVARIRRSEDDDDFGRVFVSNVVSEPDISMLPSARVEPSAVEHLDERQQSNYYK